MPICTITFPAIDPVFIHLGPIDIRRKADVMHGLLKAYEAKRWPLGKEPGGKG